MKKLVLISHFKKIGGVNVVKISISNFHNLVTKKQEVLEQVLMFLSWEY